MNQNVYRRGWRLAAAARVGLSRWRAIPVAASSLRESSSGPKHESTVVEPNGFLFNEKPLLPGEKRQKEEWENPFVYGMGFNLILLLMIAFFKPDTSVSAWAHEEALKRLEGTDESQEEEGADQPVTD